MKKNIVFLLLAVLGNALHSQTISKPPIYKGKIDIEETTSGRIIFLYQNPKYTSIIDTIGFMAENKKEALFLISEAERILAMDSINKGQYITHSVNNVKLIRYSFNQKAVYMSAMYMSSESERGIATYQEDLTQYKNALQQYEYETAINKK